ncbi:MFS transporter, partial [Streptomyces sp. SID5998]|nr:MFS transporter [Streptomyces sp. SID5998]
MSTSPDTGSGASGGPSSGTGSDTSGGTGGGPSGTTATAGPRRLDHPRQRLPLPALLALATAVFVTSLTETLPAGLLTAMSRDLEVSESATGQTVTVYAIGTALTAIPLTAVTATWRRKRLLLTAVAGFAAANTVTALSSVYGLTMAARFVAGVAAGLAWALLA